MFWQQNHKALQPLPNIPIAPILEGKEQVLYYGYYYKRHPIFKNSWSARLLLFSHTRFVWADSTEDNLVEPKRQFRKNRIQQIKPAAGPQLLPGCAFTIDDKDYVFSHDDPINIDRLVNFVVNYMQIREDFPKYMFYEPQRPIIKLGICVPGERTEYPEVSYRSDPLFTPSQIALLQGSRIFMQGAVYVDNQLRRMVVTNEMCYIFDHYGDIIFKFAPHEVLGLKMNGKEFPVNALEYNNNRDISIVLADEEIQLQGCSDSKCQWNGAIASFMGLIPSLDCIQNVKQYAEEDQQYNQQFMEVNRQLGKVGHNRLKNDDEESSSEDYVKEDEIRGLKDILTAVLINDIVEEVQNAENTSKNDSSKTDQISDLVDSALSIIGGAHQSFSDRGGVRKKRQRHKNRMMQQEEQYVQQVQLKIEQLNERFENQSNASENSSDDAAELDVQELQNRMTTYSLTMLTKVLDHAALQNDPELNTFDLIMPYFEQQQQPSEYAELVEEAAQVRRNILRGYTRQYTCTEETFQVYCGYVPEPFGDIFEFIEKICAIVPPDLAPDTIGVAFPQAQFISEKSKQVRAELMRAYQEQLKAYGEMLALMRAFFAAELELRRENEERYLLVTPETHIYLQQYQQNEPPASSFAKKQTDEPYSQGERRCAASPRNSGNQLQQRTSGAASPLNSRSAVFSSPMGTRSDFALETLIPTYLQSQPLPACVTALDIYKILIWYSEHIGQPLAFQLRKVIAQETLLSALSDNAVVQSAAEQVLRDGELAEQDEINEIIDQIAALDDAQEQRLYRKLDREHSSYYGHNLHIFGANERIRRAGQVLLQAAVTRLEARCIRQFAYFVAGGELVDIKFDFMEADKYVTGTSAYSYAQIFVPQHRHHLSRLSLQIVMDFAQYVAWMANRLTGQAELSKDVTEALPSVSFTANGKEWVLRGEFAAARDASGVNFYKRRDFVVERVSGSRPDEQLPERQFLLWLGRKAYFCKLMDGPVLQINAELAFERSGDVFVVNSEAGARLLSFTPKDDLWDIKTPDKDLSAPRRINPLTIIFALFLDQFAGSTEVKVTPPLYRLLTLTCPLDAQGATYRRQADSDEHGLLEWCAELTKRPVVLVENEVKECCTVFADWISE